MKLVIKSPLVLKMAKDAINAGLNLSLAEGIEYEKKIFAILPSWKSANLTLKGEKGGNS